MKNTKNIAAVNKNITGIKHISARVKAKPTAEEKDPYLFSLNFPHGLNFVTAWKNDEPFVFMNEALSTQDFITAYSDACAHLQEQHEQTTRGLDEARLLRMFRHSDAETQRKVLYMLQGEFEKTHPAPTKETVEALRQELEKMKSSAISK